MLRVHAGNDSFITSTKLKKEGVYEKDELEELEANWADVEAQKNFIIGRIDELAKKFPTNGFDLVNEDAPPKENERYFKEVKTLRGEVKDQNQEISRNVSTYNYIINKDRKNKQDYKAIERITKRIDGVRKRTKALNQEQSNLKKSQNKHADYLHEFGGQMREAQRESMRQSHSRVLQTKMENFHSRKSESTMAHFVIENNKKEREKARLKKCQDIKYQTNLAKIRMDTMLKDRLESINNRLLEEKHSYRKQSMRQKSRLGQIHNNVSLGR